MDYIFDETIFKETFHFQEIDTKSQDLSRLRHTTNKKFKLFPYHSHGNAKDAVLDLEEIISEFFKLALGIETNEIAFDDLLQRIKKKLVIDPEDEPFFEKTLNRMFFKDDRFRADNIGLYAYQSQPENKNAQELAFFMFCVLEMDSNDCDLIKEAAKLYPYHVMEQIVVDTAAFIPQKRNSIEKKYFAIIKGIQKKFKNDFQYMLTNGMTALEDLTNLLDLYYFYYITQASVALDHFGNTSRNDTVEFYYALDWERVSGNRKCCVNGWEQLRQNIQHLFCHSVTLELINQHKDPDLMYDYIMLQEYIDGDPKKDLLVAEEIRRAEKAYTDCIGDYKRFDEIEEQAGINQTDKAVKHLFKCVEAQFANTTRDTANHRYIDKFSEYAKSRWLKNRRKSGVVLNLTERDLIFLTKISLRNAEKIRLNNLFKEYEARGIFLDQTSKNYVQEFFTKLNLIDKKSDSGDAQYVKRIL